MKSSSKKTRAPQYIPSRLNTKMLNYKEYYMSAQEKLVNGLLAFIAGGVVGLVFYGGLFLDKNGEATAATMISNLVVFLLAGIIAVKVYIPMRTQQLYEKRKKELTRQFRSLLDTLSVALSTGMNLTDALISAQNDLKNEFIADAYIVKEVEEMINGINNNIPIEEMMESLGERSEIEDIKNFSAVFALSYRTGGNLKDIVRRTNSIISEKLVINEEIETVLTSNKSQFSVMMVIPVVLMLLLRLMSTDFAAGFSSMVGVIAITVAIGFFLLAYKLGQKIMNIEG